MKLVTVIFFPSQQIFTLVNEGEKKFLFFPTRPQLPPLSFMSGAKFGLKPGEVSVSFPVAALPDARSALRRSRRRSRVRPAGRRLLGSM